MKSCVIQDMWRVCESVYVYDLDFLSLHILDSILSMVKCVFVFSPAYFLCLFYFLSAAHFIRLFAVYQLSVFCLYPPYWAHGSISDYYSSLKEDHLVITSMTLIIWRKRTQLKQQAIST